MVFPSNRLVALLVAIGLSGVAAPAWAQALLPQPIELDSARLEEQGWQLLQEAERWAQFQQFDQALPRARLAAQLLPDNGQAWAILGRLYVQTDETDAGIAALERAKDLEPEDPSIRFALGTAHFLAEDYRQSIANFEAGLEMAPDRPEAAGALFDLGNAYYKLEEFDKAIEQYERALDRDSSFWPAANNIGLVEYERGNEQAAMDRWEEALNIQQRAAEPKLALAVVLYARGDRDRGFEMGEAALEADRRYAELEFLRENLWGEKLLDRAAEFLQTPRIQEAIARAESQPDPMQIRFPVE